MSRELLVGNSSKVKKKKKLVIFALSHVKICIICFLVFKKMSHTGKKEEIDKTKI